MKEPARRGNGVWEYRCIGVPETTDNLFLTLFEGDPWSAAVVLPLSKGGSCTPALRRCLSAH